MIHPKGNEILDTIEWAFIPPSEYNQRLFSLYLTYLRRYKINYGHIIQARRVAALLQEKPWPSFTSWQQIIHQSKELKLRPKSQPGLGCPILKIGYMLQEIGAIGPKADEKGHWISHLRNPVQVDH